MKLIRFGQPDHEKPGVELEDGQRINVAAFGEDYDEHFFGSDGPKRLAEWLRAEQSNCPIIDANERLGPPCARPSKIVCVGLNYQQHALESGMEIPPEPVLFFKSTSAIIGPNDDIILPPGSKKTDWEVELALVIGQKAKHVTVENAMQHVAAYVLHNDLSERAYQLERAGQWVKGKSYDTFAPLGPYLVTADEVPNPNQLPLWLKVNGQVMQDSNTADFVFKVAEIVAYVSQFMTLLPGDIISTGTPAGVGLGLNPPRYLKAGDVIELSIAGLGIAKQSVIN